MGAGTEGCDREGWCGVTHHIRNPIRRHGELPLEQFTIIPNELVRDADLSNYAYRIAMVLRSHAEDFEISAASLSKRLGWHRDTVGRALRELVNARRLAIQRYRTATGGRAYDVYHVHVSGQFTEAEMLVLGRPVVLARPHAHEEGTHLPINQASACLIADHPPAYSQDTTEDQQEDQSEHELEDQNPSKVPTEDLSFRRRVGFSISDLPGHQRRSRPREKKQTCDKIDNCWGCATLGEGCAVHGPTLLPATMQ